MQTNEPFRKRSEQSQPVVTVDPARRSFSRDEILEHLARGSTADDILGDLNVPRNVSGDMMVWFMASVAERLLKRSAACLGPPQPRRLPFSLDKCWLFLLETNV